MIVWLMIVMMMMVRWIFRVGSKFSCWVLCDDDDDDKGETCWNKLIKHFWLGKLVVFGVHMYYLY
jgi:hypothetical protein